MGTLIQKTGRHSHSVRNPPIAGPIPATIVPAVPDTDRRAELALHEHVAQDRERGGREDRRPEAHHRDADDQQHGVRCERRPGAAAP